MQNWLFYCWAAKLTQHLRRSDPSPLIGRPLRRLPKKKHSSTNFSHIITKAFLSNGTFPEELFKLVAPPSDTAHGHIRRHSLGTRNSMLPPFCFHRSVLAACPSLSLRFIIELLLRPHFETRAIKVPLFRSRVVGWRLALFSILALLRTKCYQLLKEANFFESMAR